MNFSYFFISSGTGEGEGVLSSDLLFSSIIFNLLLLSCISSFFASKLIKYRPLSLSYIFRGLTMGEPNN